MWKEFFEDLSAAGVPERPHYWAAIQCGHVIIGAALASLIAAIHGPVLPFMVATGYFILKELKDIRRGASLGDALIDTGFVLVGAHFTGPVLFPLIPLGLIALGITFYRALTGWLK